MRVEHVCRLVLVQGASADEIHACQQGFPVFPQRLQRRRVPMGREAAGRWYAAYVIRRGVDLTGTGESSVAAESGCPDA